MANNRIDKERLKEAYEKTGKMKDSVADVNASRMLRFAKVFEAIEARKKAIEALNPVCTAEELAEGWSEDIRFDLAELVDENGTFRSPKDLSSKTRRLIQGVKIKESIVEEEGLNGPQIAKRLGVCTTAAYKAMRRAAFFCRKQGEDRG